MTMLQITGGNANPIDDLLALNVRISSRTLVVASAIGCVNGSVTRHDLLTELDLTGSLNLRVRVCGEDVPAKCFAEMERDLRQRISREQSMLSDLSQAPKGRSEKHDALCDMQLAVDGELVAPALNLVECSFVAVTLTIDPRSHAAILLCHSSKEGATEQAPMLQKVVVREGSTVLLTSTAVPAEPLRH